MLNYAIIIIDYYMEFVEVGETKEHAKDMALKFMTRFKEQMKSEDYLHVYEIINRLTKI